MTREELLERMKKTAEANTAKKAAEQEKFKAFMAKLRARIAEQQAKEQNKD
jgi:hypothetical protein